MGITQLVPSGPTRQAVRSSFAATIFRNHFEDHPDTHPGQRVRLADATVGVQRIIRFQRLDPRTPELPQLNYVLFGSGRELYMAHVITRPPDFDQLLSVKIIDQPLAIETLCQGILVMIPGRTNDIASKIQEGERFPGHIQNGDESSETLEIQLEAGVEFYFETQDLTSEM